MRKPCYEDRWCRSPDCEECEERKSWPIKRTLRDRTRGIQNLLAITLTVPTSDDPLDMQIKRLLKNVRDLLKLPAWKASIAGGVYSFDITYDPMRQTWHPHLHILAEGDLLNVTDIQHDWLMLTGGDQRTFNPIHDQQYWHAQTQYVAKSPYAELFKHPEALRECIRARRGCQLKRTFGSFRGTPLTPRRGTARKRK